jgi:hypothetical protein
MHVKEFAFNVSEYYHLKEVVQIGFSNIISIIMTCASVDFSTCCFAILCYATCHFTVINIRTHTVYVVAVCLYSVDIPAFASICRVM